MGGGRGGYPNSGECTREICCRGGKGEGSVLCGCWLQRVLFLSAITTTSCCSCVYIQEAVLLDITILGMCRGFQHSKLHYSPTVGKPEVANAAQFEIAGCEGGGRSTLFEDKTCTQKGMENG